MKKILNKLILGGAQLSTSKYGITNKLSSSSNEKNKILNFAYSKGIRYIDSARSYKNSEKIIGKNKKKFKIISKIGNFPKNINCYEKYIEQEVKNTLNNLKINKLYGLLIHSQHNLSKIKFLKIVEIFKVLKQKNKVKLIGISIYDSSDLEFFWEFWKPEIIQVPYNIFDKRIETSGWLKKIKKKKIEIHARSVFMQGLLISSKNNLSNKNNKLINKLNSWFLWCKKNNFDPIEKCLSVILNKNFDKIIIGVNSLQHLKKIIMTLSNKTIVNRSSYNIVYNSCFDPRKWK